MSRPAEPTIADLLADLDRAHAEKKERFLQSIADRRLAAERFARLKEEVVHPVFYELERELSRRRHLVKVRDTGPVMELTVAVHAVTPRSGALRLSQVEGELDTVEIEFVGIPMLRKKFTVDTAKVDRGMVTRAVSRLVEGLLAPG